MKKVIIPWDLFGFLPNPFSFYILEQDKVRKKNWFIFTGESAKLQNAEFDYPDSMFRFIGFGKLVIRSARRTKPYVMNGIFNPTQYDEHYKFKTPKLVDNEQRSDVEQNNVSQNAEPLKFASQEEITQHCNRLSAISREPSEPSVAPLRDGRWVEKTKTPINQVITKNGVSSHKITPNTLAWSPNGERIAIGFEARGLNIYDNYGNFVGGNSLAPDIGESEYLFWSMDGRFVHHIGISSTGYYHLISDVSGVTLATFRPHFTTWVVGGENLIHGTREATPFRPGTREFMAAPFRNNTIAVFQFDKLSDSWKKTSNLSNCIPEKEYSLSILGAQFSFCERYYWHPSGQYIALSTSDGSRDGSKASYVVSLEEGIILKSWPDNILNLGWSEGGKYLLLVGCDNNAFTIWDSSKDEQKTYEFVSLLPHWAKVRATKMTGKKSEFVNSIGEKKLQRSGLKSQNKITDQFHIQSIESSTPEFSLESSHILAAWSPSDPNVFASISKEKEYHLHIWEYSI